MQSVLVVEDSVSARAFVRAVLESPEFQARVGKCQVTEATSGFDAMRLLPRGPYDLIVTDINMSDINGLELVRFIRKSAHHAKTALIIISSMGSPEDVARGMALGADAYLPKPFTPSQLADTCALAMQRAGSAHGAHSSEPPPGGP
jgi:two-component system chemotaxis response regulator CheY